MQAGTIDADQSECCQIVHFIVCIGRASLEVILTEPALGKRLWSRSPPSQSTGKGKGAVLIKPPLQTHEARCPHCHGKMKLIRHITLADLPDLYVFYCSHCQHVETVKEELIAA
jgi:hypothetical protein